MGDSARGEMRRLFVEVCIGTEIIHECNVVSCGAIFVSIVISWGEV